jgi:hypothetical protein
MSTNTKTIVVRGNLNQYHDEFPADAALSPGHVLQKNSDGEVLKTTSAEGKAWNRLIAKENALLGATEDDAYAAADVVPVHVCQPGDIVRAFLTPGVSYAIGDQLILSDTAGQLKKLASVSSGVTVRKVVGEIRTALNLSASGAVATKGEVFIY